MSDESETFLSAEGSRVVHTRRDCPHLDRAKEENIEEKTEEEAESLRECRQCWYDNLSYEEKRKRERKHKRGRRTSTVKVRFNR